MKDITPAECYALSDWIKPATMNPLQERVTALGVCSFCHEKTLIERHVMESYRWMQCGGCGVIFVLEQH